MALINNSHLLHLAIHIIRNEEGEDGDDCEENSFCNTGCCYKEVCCEMRDCKEAKLFQIVMIIVFVLILVLAIFLVYIFLKKKLVKRRNATITESRLIDVQYGSGNFPV